MIPGTAEALLAVVRTTHAELHRGATPAGIGLDSRLEQDLGFDSLARVELLQRVEPDGVAGGYLRLHPRPPRQRLRRQQRRTLVKVNDGAVNGKEAVLPLQGINTGADGHGADPADIGRSRFFPAASPRV